MKKVALASAILLAVPFTAQADLLFTVGAKASIWDAESTGQIDKDISVEKDGLNLKSENGNQITVFFEHPVPVIPNIKIRQTDLEMDGKGSYTTGFNFAGQNFSASTDVDSTINLTHTDITAYWGLDRKSTRLNSSHVR